MRAGLCARATEPSDARFCTITELHIIALDVVLAHVGASLFEYVLEAGKVVQVNVLVAISVKHRTRRVK